MDRRNVLWGVALGATAAVVVAGLFALSGWMVDAPEGAVEAQVRVVDVHGNPLHDGAVRGVNLTVLDLLDEASTRGGFPYHADTYPGMGSYVTSINGTEADGSSGWVFRVLRDGSWCWGDRAPDRAPVQDGDRVVWEWTEEATGGGCWDAA